MIELVGAPPTVVTVDYDPLQFVGRLALIGDPTSSIWERLRARALEDAEGREVSAADLALSWPGVLSILRDFGTRQQQLAFGFRFKVEADAAQLVAQFTAETRRARESRSQLTHVFSETEVLQRLTAAGFTGETRRLRPFQMRDLLRLLALPHGANFSVPGAGKTTVTFALHLLTRRPGSQLVVIAPKSAFPAWMAVVDECIDPDTSGAADEPFVVLDGSIYDNDQLLRGGGSRFVMTYDLMVRQQTMLAAHFSSRPVHLVLDEAHRMKAGADSQRGAFLLNIAPLLSRRDILTGTPMPQGPRDLASQLAFLWPGQGMDLQVQRGVLPRDVLGNLYVRTTKRELGLPEARRHFLDVDMLPGQQALYAVVRDETLRQLASSVRRGGQAVDFLSARRSVMRLLQLSVNPMLALRRISEDYRSVDSGLVDAVIQEGPSSKMRAVTAHAREIVKSGGKVVIWTIFTETLTDLEAMLADVNAVSIRGATPSGSPDDPSTREGRLRRFHEDGACGVLVANPAAAGEGISLHTVCHDAIYVDRSYVSTHYLQSIDRIHRLGLPPDVETNIYIYRTKAPAQLGSIDYSVSRRLAQKIRGLQQLLDDTDLHEIAFDEEMAEDPVDYSVDLQDLVNLVAELEGQPVGPTEEDDV